MSLSGPAAGRGSRLRLTRKKPPAAPSSSSSCSGPGGGGQEGRTSSNSSWLEQEGLNESDELWRLLVLSSVNSSLHRANPEMPDLPAFLDKNIRNEENSQQPAIFKVGTQEFEWTPFPPVLHFVGGQLKNLDSFHFTKENSPPQELSEQGADQQRKGTGMKSPSEPKDSSIRTAKGRLSQHLQLSQLRKKQKLWPERAPSSPACPQTLAVDTSPPGPSPWKKSGLSLGPEDAGVRKDAPSATTTSQGVVALDGCPMCQIPFTAELSQLDIDSHLAKCLSESIEDVIW